MKDIKVLVTMPEMAGEREYIDGLPAISPRLAVEYGVSTTGEQTATMLKDVEILYTNRAPVHLELADRLRWVQLHTSGFDRNAQAILELGTILVTNVAGAHGGILS